MQMKALESLTALKIFNESNVLLLNAFCTKLEMFTSFF